MDELKDLFNDILGSMFNEDFKVNFDIKANNQISVHIDTELPMPPGFAKNRIVKRNQSTNFISDFKRCHKRESKIICILDFLNTANATNSVNWGDYIRQDFEINEEIIEKSQKLLIEANETLYELYLESIEESIASYTEAGIDICRLWSKYLYNQYNVIDNLNKLNLYYKIEFIKKYPMLILKTPLLKIKLNKDTDINLIQIINDEDELDKIKETGYILNSIRPLIYNYIELEKYTQSKIKDYVLNFNSNNQYMDNVLIYDCSKRFKEKIDIYPKFKIGHIQVGALAFNLNNSSNDSLSSIKDKIDNYLNKIYNTTINEFNTAIEYAKNKFNESGIYYILLAIEDFRKKGITTYVDILAGERSSKISTNGYDKTNAYGKLNDFTKYEITKKIRGAIKNGLIIESVFKASFGSYIGLTLSEESINYLSNYSPDTSEAIENDINKKIFNTFLEFEDSVSEFVSASRSKDLLYNLKRNLSSFEPIDMKYILSFIENKRYFFREIEDEFIQIIAEITPEQYKPIYLLNANLSTGVTHNTLKAIYEAMNNSTVKIDTKLN